MLVAARLIVEHVSHLVLFGEITGLVKAQVSKLESPSSKLEVHEAGTLENAVKVAAQVVRPGDVVLLAPGGTSFDAFKDFAERGDKFAEYVNVLE